ncbi:MAG: polyphosphate kinase 2 family protein [Anaerolineales bacterium]
MDRYRVKPGSQIDLDQWDPNDKGAFEGGKAEGKTRLRELNEELETLQELLYAEHKHKMLIVLQGMDTSGKDGTIRHVFEGVNPQGVKVASFGRPTEEELDHDYLWRAHKHTPGKGEIVIFNRSHYEDVLVVRVHNLVPEEVWRKRYQHIDGFERMLADEGIAILKFFLHIDPDEQKERLQARLDTPNKRWKFDKADLKERKRWPEYMTAFEAVLGKTSTEWAPWYIVPSNRKWYRNLVIASVIVDTLKGLNMAYPEAEEGLDDLVVENLRI